MGKMGIPASIRHFRRAVRISRSAQIDAFPSQHLTNDIQTAYTCFACSPIMRQDVREGRKQAEFGGRYVLGGYSPNPPGAIANAVPCPALFRLFRPSYSGFKVVLVDPDPSRSILALLTS